MPVARLSKEQLGRLERDYPELAIRLHTFGVKLLSVRLELATTGTLSAP